MVKKVSGPTLADIELVAAYIAGLATLVFIDWLAIYGADTGLMNRELVLFFVEISILGGAVTLAAFLHTHRHSSAGLACLVASTFAWWLATYLFASLTLVLVPLALLSTVAASAAIFQLRERPTRHVWHMTI